MQFFLLLLILFWKCCKTKFQALKKHFPRTHPSITMATIKTNGSCTVMPCTERPQTTWSPDTSANLPTDVHSALISLRKISRITFASVKSLTGDQNPVPKMLNLWQWRSCVTQPTICYKISIIHTSSPISSLSFKNDAVSDSFLHKDIPAKSTTIPCSRAPDNT